jgi:hypothetical protein
MEHNILTVKENTGMSVHLACFFSVVRKEISIVMIAA